MYFVSYLFIVLLKESEGLGITRLAVFKEMLVLQQADKCGMHEVCSDSEFCLFI